MGDLFHQTNANQTATNQQIGISTRDVGGSITTFGAGAVGPGGSVRIESLDPAALNIAANAVHDSLAANTATSLSAMQAFQQALTVTGETTAGALQLAASGAGSGASINPNATAATVASVLNPSTVIWVVLGVVGVVIALGYFRKGR